MQLELAGAGGPSPVVVLCCNNKQAQLNFMKDEQLSKPSLTKNTRRSLLGKIWLEEPSGNTPEFHPGALKMLESR